MSEKTFFFAGGGTGGHIYPALAVAQQLSRIDPAAKLHFFCSARDIDLRILAGTSFECTVLPAKGFSVRPAGLLSFCSSFIKSSRLAKTVLAHSRNQVVVGVGGFVAAPVCWTAHKLGIPIVLLNVDILPGRANKILARWAKEIFVQFADTAECFSKTKAKISVTGCPLRSGFEKPQPQKAIEDLGLNKKKKILLITGASSGSESINQTICSLLDKLNSFAENWQIVHLTGDRNLDKVEQKYVTAEITAKVLGYYDDMPNLLSAADLVVGRSGAVSVAEYAAAGCPSICIPYPYHKDRHQYLNAKKLTDASAAIIVDDLPGAQERAHRLWNALEELMKDSQKCERMSQACSAVAAQNAAEKIAQTLM